MTAKGTFSGQGVSGGSSTGCSGSLGSCAGSPLAIAASHEIAQLTIVNLVGQRVTTIFSGSLEPGQYQLHWDGRDQQGRPAASGVYFYQLQLGNQQQLRRMLLLR